MNRSPHNYHAAGGVLLDLRCERVLVLVRPERDEVRLPKGHVEREESPEIAALREVAEESGYDDLEIVTPLGEQLVSFLWKGRHVQRTEHYYLMKLRSKRQGERLPEDVAQFFPVWVTWEEAITALTFEAEKEWVRRARAEVESAAS